MRLLEAWGWNSQGKGRGNVQLCGVRCDRREWNQKLKQRIIDHPLMKERPLWFTEFTLRCLNIFHAVGDKGQVREEGEGKSERLSGGQC